MLKVLINLLYYYPHNINYCTYSTCTEGSRSCWFVLLGFPLVFPLNQTHVGHPIQTTSVCQCNSVASAYVVYLVYIPRNFLY